MNKQAIEYWLRDRIAAEINLRAEQVDTSAPLIGYLMNGFQSFTVVSELEKVVGKRLPSSILYTRATIADLAEHLAGHLVNDSRYAKFSVTAAEIGS